jgi:hypothetical protein
MILHALSILAFSSSSSSSLPAPLSISSSAPIFYTIPTHTQVKLLRIYFELFSCFVAQDHPVCFEVSTRHIPRAALIRSLQALAPCPSSMVVFAYPPRLPSEARFIADFRALFEVSISQLGANGSGMVVAEGFRKGKSESD